MPWNFVDILPSFIQIVISGYTRTNTYIYYVIRTCNFTARSNYLIIDLRCVSHNDVRNLNENLIILELSASYQPIIVFSYYE